MLMPLYPLYLRISKALSGDMMVTFKVDAEAKSPGIGGSGEESHCGQGQGNGKGWCLERSGLG